ncbi:tRNA (uracil(54)-C(5))-methyltransferase homolog [Branchiostoma floridae]|uniref:tRNA (uracil(54)-C(5))-methyltransferase n=1 Tax=Branchiostoma floridae TaxID=7739 RepID=A0A9J7LU33_BRAFL|nr:tRNA (uracil(54)-C(5))-methyltransferase homolog [Branchiostoma floridae]
MAYSTTTKMAAPCRKIFACASRVPIDFSGVSFPERNCFFFQHSTRRVRLAARYVWARSIVSFRKLESSLKPGEPQNVTENTLKDEESIQDRLLKQVIPLWRSGMSYEAQLKWKYHEAAHVLKILARKLSAVCPPDWPVMRQAEENSGMCCPLDNTKPSPITEGYRNKSGFSINKGPDGNEKTVGLFAGRGRRYNIICVPADRCINIPEAHLQVARVYQQYIRSSPLPACILFHEGGHWRDITVRTNVAGDKMVIITFFPGQLSQEDMEAEKSKIVEFFINGPGKVCNITSLYFQASEKTRSTHQEAPYQLLHGEPYIYETCLGRQFRISPEAFFQTNTPGAEVLYQTIAEISGVTANTTLLDICCGTGTIGIVLADSVKKVIGVEVVSQAVEDANVNAVLNDVENAEFICGKAETVLPHLVPELQNTPEVVAVVDPARKGLNPKVTGAIRNCPSLNRLVYISCKPRGETMRNFIELCGPPTGNVQGPPFVPVQAVPIDMFPHTSHVELVVLFERQKAQTV